LKLFRSIRRSFDWLVEFNEIEFFPIRHHLKGYDALRFGGDVRTGINIALMAFPQGMAYALIAGLPIQFGIYCFIGASFLAPFFASSRFNSYGPSNATAVLVLSSLLALQFTPPEMVMAVPLMVLLAGIFLILGAYFKVGRLIQYVSRTVITGYITVAALLIIFNQVRNVLGFEIPTTASFIGVASETLRHIHQTHFPSLLLGLATLGIYLGLNRILPKLPNIALTLVLATAISIGMTHYALEVATLDALSLKDFTFADFSFSSDLLTQVAGAALALSLLISLEASAIGKSLAARAGDRLRVNQELFSLGAANIGSALLGGMAASASLTRSTVSFNSKIGSPLGHFFASLIVAALFLLLSGTIEYIPRPSLAVLVICIGVSLINAPQIRLVSQATRSDSAVFFITVAAGMFFALDTAIYLGTAVSIVLFLRKVAEPEMVEYTFNPEGQLTELQDPSQRSVPEISIVHVEGELFFGAAEIFYEQMRRVCDDPNLKVVILKLRNAHHLDATSVLALKELVGYMQDNGRILLISEARKDAIKVFKRSGMMEVIGRDFIIPDNPTNPTKSTSTALRKAMSLIGDREAEVKIFVGTSKKEPGSTKDGKKVTPDGSN